MPEPNTRVVVEGMPAAERDYSAYVAERVEAEQDVRKLNRELRELRRMSAELLRQAEEKRR